MDLPTVTLPQIDDDLNGVAMGTYFIVVEGAELIVAWNGVMGALGCTKMWCFAILCFRKWFLDLVD